MMNATRLACPSFSPTTAALAAVLVFASGAVRAEDYPTSPIRLVVPWSAGGATDTASRTAEDALSRAIGARVYIENRPGGSGIIGTATAVQSKPDGYTLLLGAIPNLVLIPAVKHVNYDAFHDFTPLGMIWDSPHVLVVKPSMGVNTLSGFISRAKTHPNQITIGAGGGTGSMTHMSNLLLQREAGIQLINVPYTATAGAVTNLLGGQIDSMFGDVALLKPHIGQADGMVPLGVTAPKRSFLLPDVPTLGELGFPRVLSGNSYGLYVSSHAPPEVIAKLQSAVLQMQNDPDYVEALAKQGIEINLKGAKALETFMQAQAQLWTPIIKESGIRF